MEYFVSIDNIKCAKYGIINKVIDVTEEIINLLNEKNTIIISEVFLPVNLFHGKLTSLTIYLKDNGKINLLHGHILTKLNKDVIENNHIISDINIDIHSNILTKNRNTNYILSTNVRDENNIIEWIIYHLLIGFDKIVIIDHKSIKPVIQLIQPYSWKKKVHVIRREDEGPVKLKFLNEIIVPYMRLYCRKYFIHLDADEYIYIKNGTIGNLLDKYNADILTLNWLMFGCNNIESNNQNPKLLIQTFTKSSNTLDQHFKCFIKIKKNISFKFTSPHTIKYNIGDTIYTNVLNKKSKNSDTIKLFNDMKLDSNIDNLNQDSISAYINHYYVQSKEDYLNRKIKRNRDDISAPREIEDNIFNLYNDIDNNNLSMYVPIINNILKTVKTFGFIILRHVMNEETNKSWIRCYESIRKFYYNDIIIIDDNSNKDFLTDHPLVDTKIIKSEFPKRGELLPYYYYIKNNFFSRAVVLHDSMVINKYYDFMNINRFNNYSRIFSFSNSAYQIDIEYFKEFCSYVKEGSNIYRYHLNNIKTLIGCFGVCYVIDYDFLQSVEKRFNITNLVNIIDNRKKRMTLERFLSCLFEYTRGQRFITPNDIFGSIFNNKNEYIQKYYFGR